MSEGSVRLQQVFDDTFDGLDRVTEAHHAELTLHEVGTVTEVGAGVAHVRGLPAAKADELLKFEGNRLAIAFNLDEEEIGCVLLDASDELEAGSEVRRTGRVLDVPVGDSLLGRVIDPVGRPLDARGPVHHSQRMECEQDAPPIMDRLPVTVPLQTGLKVVDALIPIGRGQRELILGDRQTGKSTVALDTIINQKETDVLCIYCSIGQRSTAVARAINDLESAGALEYCVVVVGQSEAPPGLRFVSPYAATSIGEYFMQQGRDVLIVYDDLTSHARAYRELSLLLGRPPGREAYPGDIFYIHSRMLERSTHLREEAGGGSLTALPIVETQAQNVSAYIPTNLISITDGQIYLSPELFRKGILPAADVGRSVSRVGGKTQLPAYRAVAGDLRLSYSQFEELEKFARFSSQLDEDTRQALERGRRVREVLKQTRYQPIPVPEQIAVFVAVNSGALDAVPLDQIAAAEAAVRERVVRDLPDQCERIVQGQRLEDGDLQALREAAQAAVATVIERPRDDEGESDANA